MEHCQENIVFYGGCGVKNLEDLLNLNEINEKHRQKTRESSILASEFRLVTS